LDDDLGELLLQRWLFSSLLFLLFPPFLNLRITDVEHR